MLRRDSAAWRYGMRTSTTAEPGGMARALLLRRCLQRSKARAWLHWGVLFIVCAPMEFSEVTAIRRSVRASRIGQNPSQVQSLVFSGPAAQALAQFAEEPLSGTPASVAWRHTHENYVKWVELMEEAGNPWQFVFYGDATVEALRGSSVTSSRSLSDQGATFWDAYFQSLKAAWFGIAEDGVRQVAFRLLDGEFPKKRHPPLVVLAIGSKDLLPPWCNKAHGEAVKEGWRRIIEFIQEQAPSTHILALGLLPESRLLPDICTDLMREVNSYLETLANGVDHVQYVDLESLFPTVQQGAGEEDQVLLRRISHPREGKPDEFNEHYVPDSSHNGNWVVEVVCEHVSKLVAEVLGRRQGVQSPPVGSTKPAVPRALNVKTRSTRVPGRKGLVRMQVRSEVMRPHNSQILYIKDDTVSEEEAGLHDDT